MLGHLDEVVGGVGVDTARRLHQVLVLNGVRLVEKTFTGQSGHLRPGDEDLVLVDYFTELLISRIFCCFTQRKHFSLETTALLK